MHKARLKLESKETALCLVYALFPVLKSPSFLHPAHMTVYKKLVPYPKNFIEYMFINK